MAGLSLKELHSRLCCVEILIGVCAQHADDHCEFRENLECARIAVDYLLRDLEFWGLPA
jgi:hypothetical protein